MKTTNARIHLLATVAAALLLALQGYAWAGKVCCQKSGSCADTFHPDSCRNEGGQVTGGTCDPATQLCGDTEVCCDEAQGPCTQLTASECAATEGTPSRGTMCSDVSGTCGDCTPEGLACPQNAPIVDGVHVGVLTVFNPDGCCSGKSKCSLLGIDWPCPVTPVDIETTPFTCTCLPYGYADASSLTAPPSKMLAVLYGAGAFGLLLPARRRRRRK